MITTRRLSIRPWELADAMGLHQAMNFRAVTRMTAAAPYPYVLSDAKAWIIRCRRWGRRRPLEHLHLAIIHDGKVVGAMGADRDGEQAEIGYWLTPALHGQGMMTEAVAAFTAWLFRTWKVQRLVARSFLFNPASARVLEKCGFTKTALEPRAIHKNGKWLDAMVFTRYR